MKIALIQTNPQEDVARNVDEALSLVQEAARGGAHTIVLPEVFAYMGGEAGRLASADRMDEGVFARLGEAARALRINLVAGSHSETSDVQGRVFNTSVTFDPSGERLATYRKIHLFNLKDARGNPLYCESDVFAPGEEAGAYALSAQGETWSCATAICYDLRFPELFRRQVSRHGPLDVVFLPAAFTHQTGQDHWEVLLRARAIENQCFMVACNQTGFHSGGRKRNYGNSMIVDPWGQVIERAGEATGILTARLNKAALVEARTRLPALADRVLP